MESLCHNLPVLINITNDNRDNHSVVVDGYYCHNLIIHDIYIYIEDLDSFMQGDIDMGECAGTTPPDGYRYYINSYRDKRCYFQINEGYGSGDETFYNLNQLNYMPESLFPLLRDSTIYTNINRMYYNYSRLDD